jgi:hypothetical protein
MRIDIVRDVVNSRFFFYIIGQHYSVHEEIYQKSKTQFGAPRPELEAAYSTNIAPLWYVRRRFGFLWLLIAKSYPKFDPCFWCFWRTDFRKLHVLYCLEAVT